MNGAATIRACDRCGRELRVGADPRYEVVIDVRAAYDPLEIDDELLSRDHEGEIGGLLDALEALDEEEAMDQVHRRFSFDLCARCQRAYLRNPLPR